MIKLGHIFKSEHLVMSVLVLFFIGEIALSGVHLNYFLKCIYLFLTISLYFSSGKVQLVYLK